MICQILIIAFRLFVFGVFLQHWQKLLDTISHFRLLANQCTEVCEVGRWKFDISLDSCQEIIRIECLI